MCEVEKLIPFETLLLYFKLSKYKEIWPEQQLQNS